MVITRLNYLKQEPIKWQLVLFQLVCVRNFSQSTFRSTQIEYFQVFILSIFCQFFSLIRGKLIENIGASGEPWVSL